VSKAYVDAVFYGVSSVLVFLILTIDFLVICKRGCGDLSCFFLPFQLVFLFLPILLISALIPGEFCVFLPVTAISVDFVKRVLSMGGCSNLFVFLCALRLSCGGYESS